MPYGISLISLIVQLLGHGLWVATPSLPISMSDRWFARSVTSPPLEAITQGHPLTFTAYGQSGVAEGDPTVTQVYPVRSDVLAVEIETGAVVYGQQQPYVPMAGDLIEADHQLRRQGQLLGYVVGPDQDILYTFDQFQGRDLSRRWAEQPASYRLRSATDANFQTARSPDQVFQKQKPIHMARTRRGKQWSQRHTVYLQLPHELQVGATYQLSFQGAALAPVTFTYDPQQQRSEAVHVAQTGFRPQDPVKVGFLSTWMGTGGGLTYASGLTFWLVDEQTDAVVYTGKTQLSLPADTPEDPYRNYNQTDVHIMTFSEFQQPGVYRICVETVGCSFSFPIAESVWQTLFWTSVRGLYHQRSGLEIGPPYTTYRRPRAFHPEDEVVVYQSRAKLMDTRMGWGQQNAFEALVAGRTDETLPEAWGGYFDAGDWDRRIQHLDVARSLLELVELFPDTLATVDLNLPESDNDLPDLVDEARWGIDLFRRLQKPDGGIPGGIESAAHPQVGEASWQESLPVMAYAPDVLSSYFYAGVAAQAAFVLAPFDPVRAKEYEDSALKAMAYAETHYLTPPEGGWPHPVRDLRNLAALELWRLTARDRWHQLFLDTTVFTDPQQRVVQWREHNQTHAAFLYARLARDRVDPAVQANARQALLRQADQIADLTEQTAFQWSKEDPYAPVGWGVSWASPGECQTVLRAHSLTQDDRYLEATLRATQFPLGANPDNVVYTTGLGHRSPQHPLIVDQRIMGVDPPPGITVYGPIDITSEHHEDYWFIHEFVQDEMVPAPAAWPPAENYMDVYLNVAMSEFTIMQTIMPSAYVWGYLSTQD